MSDDTPDSLIPYDSIVQEALRAVVGRVLGEVAPAAMPWAIWISSVAGEAANAAVQAW